MALGISIYPEHARPEDTLAYLDRASAAGATRVFTCLLSAEADRATVEGEYRALSDAAHARGMAVTVDVAPSVFSRFGLAADDLSLFQAMHVDCLRLDEAFTGEQVAALTHNGAGLSVELNASVNDGLLPAVLFQAMHVDCLRLDEAFTGEQVAALTHNGAGLSVELNASVNDGLLPAVLANDPDRRRLQACHNFYPQPYCGLDLGFFEQVSQPFRDAHVPLAAFVGCTDHGAFGPWPLHEGLPTLECHRDLPLDLQVRHLQATGLVDDVLVSDCYPTDRELATVAALDPARVTLRPVLSEEDTDLELEILSGFPHQVRGDLSPYLFRSTMSRVAYAGRAFPAHDTRPLVEGDVVIVNENSARYAGELQIVRRAMPNDGTRNVVGHLGAGERLLLPCLTSWKHFGFLL